MMINKMVRRVTALPATALNAIWRKAKTISRPTLTVEIKRNDEHYAIYFDGVLFTDKLSAETYFQDAMELTLAHATKRYGGRDINITWIDHNRESYDNMLKFKTHLEQSRRKE